MFRLESWQVHPIVRRFSIAYAVFPDRMGHYSKNDFVRVVAAIKPSVDAQLAARIMGYKNAQEARLAPGIEVVPSLIKPNGAFVSQESLRSYLRLHLPPWVEVDDWIEDCMASSEPFVSMSEVEKILTISRRNIREVLQEQQARYIVRRSLNGSTTLLVSPFWMQAQIEVDSLLTDDQVGWILGVTPQAVCIWKKNGLRICPISFHAHAESDAPLWRSCWVAYLRDNCSPALIPQLKMLVHRQLAAQESELLSTGRLAQLLGYSPSTVSGWAASGRLAVIRTPGGGYRTTVRWARRAGIRPKS